MARMVNKEPSEAGMTTADRVLSILSAFQRGDLSLELAELAKRTRLVKTTVMRLLASLEKTGFIVRLSDGSYQLGAELLRLGSVYQQSFDLEQHVVPVLTELEEQFGESASFYVRHGNQRLCMYRVESRHRLREHIRPGDVLPLGQSATSRLLRAFADPSEEDASQIQKLPLYSSGKQDPHTSSLAMPIFGTGQKLIGVLTLSGPVTRLTEERAAMLMKPMREAGAKLSRVLGGSLPVPARTQRKNRSGMAVVPGGE